MRGRRALCTLGLFFLAPALLLLSFEWAVFDHSYHLRLHEQLNSAAATGLSFEDLQRASDALLDYLADERADIALTATVYGVPGQAVFNPREELHMRDVLHLFRLERAVRTALLAAAAVCLLLGLVRDPIWRVRLRRCGLWALGAWLLLFALVAIWAAADFEGLFIQFHHLLFTNALWQMDPATDLMIRMLPQAFFEAMAGRIAAFMAGAFALAAALCCLPAAFNRRKRA